MTSDEILRGLLWSLTTEIESTINVKLEVRLQHLELANAESSNSSNEICGQATKGRRRMPWRREAMKGVADYDKPRGAVKQALIRGCPNGETRLGSCPVIPRLNT